MKRIREWMLPYRQAVPAFLVFQFIAVIVTGLWLFGFSKIAGLLIRSTGRVALSSGDFLFLFTTWQGYVIIILALLTLFVLVSVDVNSLVILCGRLLRNEKPSILLCIKEGFLSIRYFFNPIGLLLILYLAILSPILGFGVTINLTHNLYIPKFITSVIFSKPLYTIGVIVVFAALFIIGLLFIFIFHGTLLDKMSTKESGRNSIRLIRKNLKDFIKSLVLFILLFALVLLVFVVLLIVMLIFREAIANFNMSLFVVLMLVLLFPILFLCMLFSPFYLLKITMMYNKYMSDGSWAYQKRKNRVSPFVIAIVVGYAAVVVLATTAVFYLGDELFTGGVNTGYIAHRAGGTEAPENTVAGVEAAYNFGASGSEIDIQRTSDGYYVVNHDNTFKRTAGVDKKPSEMTLAEVKELSVEGHQVPTLEEMLEASYGKVILYVELKGETADRKMADDAVKIIKDMEMEDQSVLISLKYDLIDYIEKNYPEMQTGYLAFASFGDTASLNCDYLALEEETATSSMISDIHEKGKKVFVWTVNDEDDIEDFLDSDADQIITDNIKAAQEATEALQNKSLVNKLYDRFMKLFSSF